MGATARHQLPYPEISDPPDGATQIGALAAAVDTALPLAGTVTITVSGSSVATGEIRFPHTFATPPVVTAAVSNSFYTCSVSSITTTTAAVAVRDIRGTTGNANIVLQWVAVGRLAGGASTLEQPPPAAVPLPAPDPDDVAPF